MWSIYTRNLFQISESFTETSTGGFGSLKPVEGKKYDLEVTEISRKGNGIARIQGFVIFVKGGKVGEKTKVKTISIGPKFAIAEEV